MATQFKVEPRHWILIFLLFVAGYSCYLLVEPYMGSIVLGFIMSILFLPVHNKLHQWMPKSPNLTSLLSCTLLTIIVLIPLLIVVIAIFNQGVSFFTTSYAWLTNGGAKELIHHPWVTSIFALVDKWLPFDSIKPEAFVQRAAEAATNISTELVGASTKILGDISSVMVNFALMLFVLFFFLRDNDKIINALRHVIPLSRSQEDQIFLQVEQVTKSAVLGSFITAIAQGFAGGIAMALAGFPGLFWGSIMAFASFIPFIGTALIWLPAAGYLMLTGEWQWAIFLVIWGILVVGSIDNFLRPLLMQGHSGMNTLMLFFSLLGGLQLFGLIGLIYGPIIFAVTLVLFKLYDSEFKDFLTQQDNQ